MTDSTSADVLSLVRKALDELDDRPLDATVRRTARIAVLLGETELAVRLGLELKPIGGLPAANKADTQRLMADPSLWDAPNSPVETAFEAYSGRRQIESGPNAGKLSAHGLAEIAEILRQYDTDTVTRETAANIAHLRAIQDGVRHTIFTALCSWERQLTYTDVNERIFERFRSQVDATLANGAPQVLDQFTAVYRRLREAAQRPESTVQEDLSQAVTTCRRILKAVADHVLPGERGATNESGVRLDDPSYRNRVHEFIARHVNSGSVADSAKAAYGGLLERFKTLDELANKGVHAQLGLREAELCAISTYLVTGELLAVAAQSPTEAESS
ncbi:hypothetical protein [Amycolatopsis keratiniphila]|uniref:AbiTii domain-containing protein n=1 Tax=Amycolatopsis keratiniphila TaxID=129921 RepID=R4SX34_9PSEU|nr:hypothetical protein [Amycolatopsis keratiniphila]AGM07095.1 hypothetical protein AORI_4511 [Amycolatopsis keratiniphila]